MSKRQLFALVNQPRPESDGKIKNDEIAEILLDWCGGLDGFIMMPNNWSVQIMVNGQQTSVDKDWLSNFWIV